MKNFEQRVKELEKEVALLKAKNRLEETKLTGTLKKCDATHYLNNYPPAPDWKNKEVNEYVFTPSVNLMSEPDLETAFASPWDTSEMDKNPLDTITVNLSSTISDILYNPNYIEPLESSQQNIPPYPDIIGSWDDFDCCAARDWECYNQTDRLDDVINKNITDDYGFKMNYEEPITSWKFVSEFDKADKDFLNHLNTTEKRIENNFGKIISKFRILNHKWEMDGYGYIVKSALCNLIITTDHGKPVVVSKEYLNAKIKEYNEIINETEKALLLIK